MGSIGRWSQISGMLSFGEYYSLFAYLSVELVS